MKKYAPFVAALLIFLVVLYGLFDRYDWQGDTYDKEIRKYRDLLSANLLLFAVTFYCNLRYTLGRFLNRFYGGKGKLLFATEVLVRVTVMIGLDYRIHNLVVSQMSARLALLFADLMAIVVETSMEQHVRYRD